VLTVPLSTALAVALGWLTERSDLPGARMWAWLTVAPLAVPAFVHSYAWVSIVPSLHGLFAGVMISTLAYFPFLYLPIAAALRRLDPALEPRSGCRRGASSSVWSCHSCGLRFAAARY
jgi:iron(III) transport system permease protein